jgi:pyruvate/2-oxoglutarate dehydrogenase complex dihydrolipoamide dehydrogenase (E3) component
MLSAMVSQFAPLRPHDDFNQRLAHLVHPPDWRNPRPAAQYDLVVLGAGTAGLVTAAGAAGLGARVALVERELMGGDCLNVGCVPSKALLHSARQAAARAGVDTVDFAAVMQRMRRLRAEIAPHDSAARFRELGVDVFFGHGRFADPSRLTVEHSAGEIEVLHFRRAVIATGSRAAVPPIDGLEGVPYLTNQTLFSLTELPRALAILGGGPIGCEMAQAFARFGSRVTLLERGEQILSKEDPAAATVVLRQLERDGVTVHRKAELRRCEHLEGDRVRLSFQQAERLQSCDFDRLLVAAGRQPNTENLGLETLGVRGSRRGVEVDDFLRTTVPTIYAAGDVCGLQNFTHAADFQARIVIQNALFALGPLGRRRFSRLVIPRCTYTSPELAHVGWTADEAEREGIGHDLYQRSFADVDRAVLEDAAEGFVKVLTQRGSDRILGATVVGSHAGELIAPLSLALTQGIGMSQLAGTIFPYPTLAEAIRQAGDAYNRTRLTKRSRRFLSLLKRIKLGG